jgi:tRNA dimethylallyltransferase
MFNYWLIEEVVYNTYIYSDECTGLWTIGYKEVCAYLRDEMTLEEAQALVAQHSRNYAKRQITWNKKYGPL